ncbi:QRFP-like peptide receptor [Saccostrea echinata]|uniref:QRFP-like peptide receptor n=1 Tax=Saccostrea echinata TaxID=191078 RepID=UPI002A81CE27|nr:QRFP-like peptide receptor [Saccostrea echinata]
MGSVHIVNETNYRNVLSHLSMEYHLEDSFHNLSDPLYHYDFDLGKFVEDMREELKGYKEPLTIALIFLYSVVFLFGLFGNIFVIITVLHYKHMRTLTNVFLVNLTISDLLVVLFCIPITLGTSVYRDYVYGIGMCKLTSFLQGSAICVSSLSLLTISINRFIAIHTPLRAKITFSKRRVYFIIVVIWCISFAVFVPLLVVNNIRNIGIPPFYNKRICNEHWNPPNGKQLYNIVVFVSIFLIPLLAMILTYTKISLVLWRNQDKAITQTKRVILQRRRTVKLLICVVVIFCVCWLPYNVINIWLEFNITTKSVVISEKVYPLLQLLAISNSAINPICYCLMSSGFQKAFLRLCCKRRLNSKPDVILMVKFKDGSSESQETELGTRVTRQSLHVC